MSPYAKVSCAQCSQYTECPQKTRMLVNYCGSKGKDLEKGIAVARLDCKSRKGHVLKHQASHHLPPHDNIQALAA